MQHVESYFPKQGSNLRPLHWKHRVLAPGPLGNFGDPGFWRGHGGKHPELETSVTLESPKHKGSEAAPLPCYGRVCQELKALWLPMAERQGGDESAVSVIAEDTGARLGRWHAWEPASLGQRPHPFLIPGPPVTPSFPVNKDVSLAPPEGKAAMALSRGR